MKIGFIGTGNMGSALATAVSKSLLSPEIYLADFDRTKAEVLAARLTATVASAKELCRLCDMVFLGVKPQGLPALLEEIAPIVKERGKDLTLISMAAGVKTDAILSCVGTGASLIRIMPNTPVAVGEGVIVYAARGVADDVKKRFLLSLSQAGLVEEIPEEKIDAASALHGCGPAFVYLFIEALADGAVACGLSRDAALRFAAGTVKGAGEMVLETGRHPGELKDAVCSPGGSTIRGVMALEEGAFRGTVSDAVIASYEKTLELGK